MSLASTVRTMDLSNNKLTAIPIALGNFTELKQLNAEHNEIGRLCLQQTIIYLLFFYQNEMNHKSDIEEGVGGGVGSKHPLRQS